MYRPGCDRARHRPSHGMKLARQAFRWNTNPGGVVGPVTRRSTGSRSHAHAPRIRRVSGCVPGNRSTFAPRSTRHQWNVTGGGKTWFGSVSVDWNPTRLNRPE
ncbi:MAG TPA: hypothetical protein PK445_07275 [Methanolinea sp.]|nr:hypothetical protein [Methanolinea sp.]